MKDSKIPLPINAMYLTVLRDDCDLSTNELVVYIMLLSRANNLTATCYPSMALLCRDCGKMDRRKLWEAIAALEEKGLIYVMRIQGKPNVYTMTHFMEWRKKRLHNQVQECT